MLAAILYLGAGLGLTGLRFAIGNRRREASLRREDGPLLLGLIAAGGVVAPLLLLAGLARVSATSGSLLLNLEGPLTAILAVVYFGEHLGGRAAGGCIAMMMGAATLALAPGMHVAPDPLGMLAIVGACSGWAIDNNLTSRLSLRDPFALAQIKGLAGGSTALAIAFATGHSVPPPSIAFAGLLIGFASYGVSLALAIYAMRAIGVAREAALFSAAPFLGVLLSVGWLHEPFGLRELIALVSMALGVWFLATERHSHRHTHATVDHDHRHTHDAHHQHGHAIGDPTGEPHAHPHTHAPLEHEHPHTQDVHHRHH